MSQTKKYDLEDRTIKFSEDVLAFCKSLPHNEIIKPLVSQLIRSATSIGANYNEANGASSKRDFRNKIFVCKKEAKETMYWVRLVATTDQGSKVPCRLLWKEAHELVMIFTTIANKSV